MLSNESKRPHGREQLARGSGLLISRFLRPSRSSAVDEQAAAGGLLAVASGRPQLDEQAVALVPEAISDGEVAPESQPDRSDETGAEMLMRLAGDARIFRGLDDLICAEVPADARHGILELDARYEILELGSTAFESWLFRSFRRDRKTLPSLEGLKRLIRALEADAMALGSAEVVWVRVADGNRWTKPREDTAHAAGNGIAAESGADAVYDLDLGDRSRDAVEIRAEGCRVVTRPPVSFRRPRGMHPLPRPCGGGSIELLSVPQRPDRPLHLPALAGDSRGNAAAGV